MIVILWVEEDGNNGHNVETRFSAGEDLATASAERGPREGLD